MIFDGGRGKVGGKSALQLNGELQNFIWPLFLGIQSVIVLFHENLSVHIFQDFAFATLVNGNS